MRKWQVDARNRWREKEQRRFLMGRKNQQGRFAETFQFWENMERGPEETKSEETKEEEREKVSSFQYYSRKQSGRRLFLQKKKEVRSKRKWQLSTLVQVRDVKVSAEPKQKVKYRKQEQRKWLQKELFQRTLPDNKSLLTRFKRVSTEVGKSFLKALYPYVVQGFLLLLPIFMLPLVVVGILYCSPFAVLAPSLSEDNDVRMVLKEMDTAYQEELKYVMENGSGYDRIEVYLEDFEGDALAGNYIDVLMVYMASYNVGQSVTLMEGENINRLEKLFQEMNSYQVRSRTERAVALNEKGEEVITYERIKEVYITQKTYRDYVGNGRLSEYQEEMLLALMEGAGESVELTGMSETKREEVLETVDNDMAQKVLDYALSQVGKPYSQEHRDSGDAFDCSSLTYYAYRQAGISLQYQGSNTAAAQGQFCEEQGWIVPKEELQAGDLIFYSFVVNGRYKNISHVAIYAGNGMVVDASSSRGCVVYRSVYDWEQIVFCGSRSRK